jgi:hypothetical protein
MGDGVHADITGMHGFQAAPPANPLGRVPTVHRFRSAAVRRLRSGTIRRSQRRCSPSRRAAATMATEKKLHLVARCSCAIEVGLTPVIVSP